MVEIGLDVGQVPFFQHCPGDKAMSKGTKSVVQVLYALSLTFVAWAMNAGHASAQGDLGKPTEHGISSVLVRLQEDKDEFERFMEQTLSPQLQRISDSFQKNVSEAELALERLKKDPKNERLRAEYEDGLSEAIAQAATFLKEFSHLETPTYKALDSVATTIEDAKDVFEKQAAESKKQSESFSKQVASARDRLSELAKRYQPYLEQKKPLPPDIDLDVRLLQVDLDTAMANEKVSRMAVRGANEAIDELQAQYLDLKQLRGDLKVAFRQGQGQHMLLGNLARVKQSRLQSQAIYQRLRAVRQVVTARKTDLGRIGHLVHKIVQSDLSASGGKKAREERAADTQEGAEILKAYLAKPDAKKVARGSGK